MKLDKKGNIELLKDCCIVKQIQYMLHADICKIKR